MNIFIIYAREDLEIKNSLVKHLSALKDEFADLNIWHDGLILGGGRWKELIKEKLQEADLFLFLISVDFLNSEFIRAVELHEALEKHKANQAKVIPVICRSCQWESNKDISSLNVLPTDGVPIKSRQWDNEDYAYSNVTAGIKRILRTITTAALPHQYGQGAGQSTYSPKKIKKSPKSIVALIVVGVVLLSFAAYFIFSGNKREKNAGTFSDVDSYGNSSTGDTNAANNESPSVIVPDSSGKESIDNSDPTLGNLPRYSFFDNFNDNSKSWSIGEDEQQVPIIENGKFYFESKGGDVWNFRPVPIDCSKDFEFSLKCRWNSGIVDNGFGMLYCAGDLGKPNYAFMISADGHYIVRSFSGNKGPIVDITPWTESATINTYTTMNVLKIKHSNNRISYFINDVLMKNLPFNGAYGARFGFIISGKQKVEFDDFSVKGIEKKDAN